MTRWLRASAAALALALPAGVVDAGTGAVTGTVVRGKGADEPVANAVVMLDGPSVAAGPDAPHAIMDQRRDTFVPRVLAIPVGTTVDFPNSDAHLHNVFSTSPSTQFDLGMYDRGETRSVTFDRPGVVRVLCNVHPMMEGFIVVHANPFVAVTDREGRYTIGGVPPGRHPVRVWRAGHPEEHMWATVREHQVERVDVRLAP